MPRNARLPGRSDPRGSSPSTRQPARSLAIEPLEDRRLLAVLTVNTLSDQTVADDGLVTLREAVVAANDNGSTDLGETGLGADQIVFDPALFNTGPGVVTLAQGPIEIASDLEIVGPSATLLTISGNNASRIFTIDDGDGGQTNAAVRLADMTLTDGLANGTEDAGRGGAIFSVESLTAERLVIQNNIAGNDGGGLLASVADGGEITIRDSTITGNASATGIGGGLSVQVLYGGYALLSNLVVTDNQASASGGGVALGAAYGGYAYLTESVLTNNAASFGGGALIDVIQQGVAAIERTTISGNTSLGGEDGYDLLGGGVAIFAAYYGSATLLQSTISGNIGGGVSAVNGYAGDVYLLETNILDNLGAGPNNYGGAGMHVVADELSRTELVRSQISGHVSRGEPGALGVAGGAGGGLYLYGYRTTTTIRDSTIANNSSTGSGGGIYLAAYASGLEIVGSTISGNYADQSGGGLYLYHDLSSAIDIAHSTITGNVADQANTGSGFGGGIVAYGAAPTLDHTILAANVSRSLTGPDLYGPATVNYTLLGNDTDAWLTIVGSGNQIGTNSMPIDPLLLPLADNGGPTPTHALATGSPAIDQGDDQLGTPPNYDQRGFPYQRIAGSAIDIGAYERQAQPADFDDDAQISGSDFLLWQRGFSATAGAVRSDGDADLDGDVDDLDLLAWEATYGVGVPQVTLLSLSEANRSPEGRGEQSELIASLPTLLPSDHPQLPAARDAVFEQLAGDPQEASDDDAIDRRRLMPTLRHRWHVL